MSTAKVISIVHPTGSITNLVNDANGGITIGGTLTANSSANITGNVAVTGFANVGGTVIMASSFKRNRIINGNMVVDQRNAGANVTIGASSSTYTLDRWCAQSGIASKFSVQQNAGAVTPPAGFTKYLGVTSLAATSSGSTDYYALFQAIEGFNTADLAWGTASAVSVTISFWVRSSLTGSFGAALANNGGSRSYPFSYTVNAANTWEQKTVTVAGDTSGTWLTDNSTGIYLRFDLGCGSSFKGTAGTWAAANYYGVTGAVSVVGTSGATWYVTGVQLEVGAKATPYEFVTYSEQLAQCQRYYNAYTWASTGWNISTTQGYGGITFPVMRQAPNITDGGSTNVVYGPGGAQSGTMVYSSITVTRSYITVTVGGGFTVNYPFLMFGLAKMDAEL